MHDFSLKTSYEDLPIRSTILARPRFFQDDIEKYKIIKIQNPFIGNEC